MVINDRAGGVAAPRATTDQPRRLENPSERHPGGLPYFRNEAVDDRTWSFELAGPDRFFALNLVASARSTSPDQRRPGTLAMDQVPMGDGPLPLSAKRPTNSASRFGLTSRSTTPSRCRTTANKPLNGRGADELESVRRTGACEIARSRDLASSAVQDDPDFTIQKSGRPPWRTSTCSTTWTGAPTRSGPPPAEAANVRAGPSTTLGGRRPCSSAASRATPTAERTGSPHPYGPTGVAQLMAGGLRGRPSRASALTVNLAARSSEALAVEHLPRKRWRSGRSRTRSPHRAGQRPLLLHPARDPCSAGYLRSRQRRPASDRRAVRPCPMAFSTLSWTRAEDVDARTSQMPCGAPRWHGLALKHYEDAYWHLPPRG